MFMGNYWERNREREKFRLNRFPIVEAKSYFLHCSLALTRTFFAVIARHRWEAINEKASLLVIKKKEQGERNVTFWSLILMFIFHEKCQSLGHVKMQNLPCNTPWFLVFLPHPEPLQRLKKICFFMGNEKCLWTPLVFTNSWFSLNANILLDFTWNPTFAPATGPKRYNIQWSAAESQRLPKQHQKV